MVCSINDYFLADGTIAGGYSLTQLRLKVQRVFDVVVPIQEVLDGDPFVPLEVGMAYKILVYVPGDDFSYSGGVNVTGDVFIAIGSPIPTDWLNHSQLQPISPVLLDRNKRRVDVTFNVQRVQDTINDADTFCLEHEFTVPRTGNIKLFPGPEASTSAFALIVNGNLLSHELVKQTGKFTEHTYHIVGSPVFPFIPGGRMLLETGDFMLLETGGKMLLE